jgi:hypothetical protein
LTELQVGLLAFYSENRHHSAILSSFEFARLHSPLKRFAAVLAVPAADGSAPAVKVAVRAVEAFALAAGCSVPAA